MSYVLYFDPNRCVACYACAVACMDQNDIDTAAGETSFRQVLERESNIDGEIYCEYLSLSCRHCADPRCVQSCPSGCLRKDLVTGMTAYDNNLCIGCKTCAQSCPFGVPRFNKAGKLVKCDGCNLRLRNALTPACVRACPHGALRCLSPDDFNKLQSRKREAVSRYPAGTEQQRYI